MYLSYWNLIERPFNNTPDTRYLYHSQEHEEALFRLFYAVSYGLGGAMLSGVFGCGKTLIGKALSEELRQRNYVVGYISNPQLNNVELLREIVYRLGVRENLPREKTDLLHLLDNILTNNYNDGKSTLVVIDEAHIIESREVFEELRLLLNFQTDGKFLITLLLIGQPELRDKINNIKPLAQRISIKCYLDRFSQEDTKKYILHRLKVGGWDENNEIFTEDAIESIYHYSGGIPRRINTICDFSLLAGYGKKVKVIDKRIVEDTVRGLDLE